MTNPKPDWRYRIAVIIVWGITIAVLIAICRGFGAEPEPEPDNPLDLAMAYKEQLHPDSPPGSEPSAPKETGEAIDRDPSLHYYFESNGALYRIEWVTRWGMYVQVSNFNSAVPMWNYFTQNTKFIPPAPDKPPKPPSPPLPESFWVNTTTGGVYLGAFTRNENGIITGVRPVNLYTSWVDKYGQMWSASNNYPSLKFTLPATNIIKLPPLKEKSNSVPALIFPPNTPPSYRRHSDRNQSPAYIPPALPVLQSIQEISVEAYVHMRETNARACFLWWKFPEPKR